MANSKNRWLSSLYFMIGGLGMMWLVVGVLIVEGPWWGVMAVGVIAGLFTVVIVNVISIGLPE